MKVLERLHSENTVVKAAMYARFSSEMQREESIEAQLRAMRAYAAQNGLTVVEEYIDRAKSATTDQRPEFQRMIEDSKKKMFHVLLVHKLDRFARNRYDSIGYRMELKRNGVALISVLEYFDEDSPESIILESVLEAMAEYYSKNLAREVEKGKKENAMHGKHNGGIPPLGYDLDRTEMRLVLNEHEAEVVKLIYQMYLNDFGYERIAEELNARGYKTKRGDRFSKTSLYSILKNEKYTGTYVYGKSAPKDVDGKRNGHAYKPDADIIRIKDCMPAIISYDDYSAAQYKMNNRKRRSGRCKTKEVYLLSGKVTCGVCGYGMYGNKRRNGQTKKLYVSYVCGTKDRKNNCRNKEIQRDSLEAYVLQQLSKYIFDESNIPELIREYNNYRFNRNNEKIQEHNELKKKLKSIQREAANIVTVISQTGSAKLANRLTELENEEKSLQVRIDQFDESEKVRSMDEEEIKKAFRQACVLFEKGTLSTTKQLIEMFVDRVIVYEDHLELRLKINPGLYQRPTLPKQHAVSKTGFLVPHTKVCGYDGGERGIRTLAPVNPTYTLSRGAPSAKLGYFSMPKL